MVDILAMVVIDAVVIKYFNVELKWFNAALRICNTVVSLEKKLFSGIKSECFPKDV